MGYGRWGDLSIRALILILECLSEQSLNDDHFLFVSLRIPFSSEINAAGAWFTSKWRDQVLFPESQSLFPQRYMCGITIQTRVAWGNDICLTFQMRLLSSLAPADFFLMSSALLKCKSKRCSTAAGHSRALGPQASGFIISLIPANYSPSPVCIGFNGLFAIFKHFSSTTAVVTMHFSQWNANL